MGRKRQRLQQESFPAELTVSGNMLQSRIKAQESGTEFYGESIYSGPNRMQLAPTFYPLPLDPPPPAGQHPVFLPQDFHVEQPDPELLAIPMTTLVQQLLDNAGPAAAPPPTRSKSNNQEKARTAAPAARSAEDERSLVETMRKQGHTWVHIGIKLNKSASVVRKKYTAKGGSLLQTPPAAAAAQQAQPTTSAGRHSGSGGGGTAATAAGARKGSETGNRQDQGEASTSGQAAGGGAPGDTLHAPKKSHASDPVVGGVRVGDMINSCVVNRGGGGGRVTLKRQTKRPPEGFTGQAAHGLKSLQGVKFFEEVVVQDPDDDTRFYSFSLSDRTHCASFHMGVGEDGSPILSWSDLFSFYQLPDGSRWAEHGYFHDADDVATLAQLVGQDPTGVLPQDIGDNELLRRSGRYHTLLQNIEMECWVFEGAIPEETPPNVIESESFYWRHTFDPYTFQRS